MKNPAQYVFEGLGQKAEALRLRASTMWREHKERAAEKRAERLRHMAPHAAPLIWVWFLAFIAVATLIGSTWMLMVFIAGSVGHVDWGFDWRAGNDGEPTRWQWFAEAQIHLLVGIGLLCFCLGIAAFNAVWLHVRTHLFGMFRLVVTTLGVLVALFMISGAIVVQQWGTVARERDEVIAAQTATVGATSAADTLESAETELATMMNSQQGYIAQAASVGAVEWERSYIAQAARGDPNRERIIRALGAARRADTLRADIIRLRGETRVARVEAVEAEAVTVAPTTFMNRFAFVLEEIRKPFIAVLGELLAMTMFGVALAALVSRRQTIEQSGWADEAHRIEDLRAEEPHEVRPMQPAREKMFDAQTGEELIPRRGTWAKKPKRKGVAEKVDISAPPPPDERGVEVDGGARIATTLPGVPDVSDSEAARNYENDSTDKQEGETATDPPPREANPIHDDLTQEQIDAYAALSAPHAPVNDEPKDQNGGDKGNGGEPEFSENQDDQPADEDRSEEQANRDAEASQESHDGADHPRPPETRESHLLPATVAAE